MATLLDEILGVRSMLVNPLSQSPTPEDIIEELENVYQTVTNMGNNSGNSWQIETVTLVTTAGTREYQLDSDLVQDFYKPLLVTTVPENDSQPEYQLEFTELESLPSEWAWLGQNQGSLLWTSHSSQVIAFYRKMGVDSEEIWCEMRPTPNSTQQYKILYQVGDWWSNLAVTNYTLPNKEFRFHFRALAARNLLPKTRWSYGDDTAKKAEIKENLDRRIAMGTPILNDHLMSLDNSDAVAISSYADEVDSYVYPFRYR